MQGAPHSRVLGRRAEETETSIHLPRNLQERPGGVKSFSQPAQGLEKGLKRREGLARSCRSSFGKGLPSVQGSGHGPGSAKRKRGRWAGSPVPRGLDAPVAWEYILR